MENLIEKIDKLKYQCRDHLRIGNPEKVIELLSALFKSDKYYTLNYKELLTVAEQYAVLKNSRRIDSMDYDRYTKSVADITNKLGDIVDNISLGTIAEKNYYNNNSNMLIYSSTFTENEIWENAKKDNKIRSCEYYLNKFPNGRYCKEAKEKILKIQIDAEQSQQDAEEIALFEAIKRNKTIDSCKVFLQKYPHSSRLNEVNKCMELIIWNEINQSPSIQGYNHFIRHFPNSILAIEADIKKQKIIEQGISKEEADRKAKELEEKIEHEVKKRVEAQIGKKSEALKIEYEKIIKKEIETRMDKITELIRANFKDLGKDYTGRSLDLDRWNYILIDQIYKGIFEKHPSV
jgi:hypothetical protein